MRSMLGRRASNWAMMASRPSSPRTALTHTKIASLSNTVNRLGLVATPLMCVSAVIS